MAISEATGSVAALLILRVGAAVMLFYFHGLPKWAEAYAHIIHGQEWGFISFVASLGFPFARFFAVCAAAAESVGALLVGAGLFTRYASGAVALTMVVAVYYHATKDMRIELAAMYLLAALTFVLTPPGPISLDAVLRNRLNKMKTGSEPSRVAA